MFTFRLAISSAEAISRFFMAVSMSGEDLLAFPSSASLDVHLYSVYPTLQL